MRPPPIKGQMHRAAHPSPVKLVVCNQQSQIHQILHPGIRRASRKRISMNFLGELLFPRDHLYRWLLDSCKSEPVSALDNIERLYDYITDTRVEMEPGEDPSVHT